MPDFVKCSCCNGTGRTVLNGVYSDTLRFLRRQRGEITGAKLAAIDGCKACAMNNRLAALERHGLAVSRKYGRERFYKAVRRHGRDSTAT